MAARFNKHFEVEIFGSCVLKASVDRVSVDTIDRYADRQSADISTDTRAICRPRLGRVSVDMLSELIDRRPTLSVDISVDTRPTPRPICCDRLSVVYRSTVGGVSVDCRCYRSIVNCCFAEIAAVSLPTGDAKEESIAYVRVLIERGCSSNCRHFEYICYAT